MHLRTRLEELVGVSGAEFLMNRPSDGWSDLVGTELCKFVRRRLAPNQIDEVDNIPAVTPALAIRDGIEAGVRASVVVDPLAAFEVYVRARFVDPIASPNARSQFIAAIVVQRRSRTREGCCAGVPLVLRACV